LSSTYNSVVETVGSGFQPIAQSTFFRTSLCKAGIQIDIYMVDHLRAIGPNDSVPTDLLLPNLVIHIADIREYKPIGTHLINHLEKPDSLGSSPVQSPSTLPTSPTSHDW
jgi:hypothetical protein